MKRMEGCDRGRKSPDGGVMRRVTAVVARGLPRSAVGCRVLRNAIRHSFGVVYRGISGDGTSDSRIRSAVGRTTGPHLKHYKSMINRLD